MKIDPTLAESIAREAFSEPYRQTPPLHTRALEKWLKERGIWLRWESIHHLWAIGVIHPVAVDWGAIQNTPNLETQSRFKRVNLGRDVSLSIDLGCDVEEGTVTPVPDRLPSELRESLWWHPFQLWQFEAVDQILRSRLARDAVLSGSDAFTDSVRRFASWVPTDLARLAQDDLYSSFMSLLALMLAADPFLHHLTHRSITWNSLAGETSAGYEQWQSQQTAPLLPQHGLDTDVALEWHTRLSVIARSRDHFGPFKDMVRQATPKRRAQLKGEALLSQNLYDHAELLRHYLQRFHHLNVPDELEIGSTGPREGRPTLRELTRNLGIDPQEHVWWFVEGQTEEAYLHTWAQQMGTDLRRAGLDVRNVKGTGKFKAEWLLPNLEYCQREKIFAYVTVDHDLDHQQKVTGVRAPIPNHILELDKFDQRGLFPGGYTYWCEDFVSANFTLEELASIATTLAAEAGSAVTISADEILRERDLEDGAARNPRLKIERAIRNILRTKAGVYLDKGTEWGEALGKWAVEHPILEQGKSELLSLNDDQRPITKILVMLLNAHDADYDLSVEVRAKERKELRDRPCTDIEESAGRRRLKEEQGAVDACTS